MDELFLPHIDADTSLDGHGPIELTHPTQDIDGDGVLDTATTQTDDGFLVVTDVDHDGVVDHLTAIDRDGAYASWEYRVDAHGQTHWERTDHGKLAE